MADIVDSLLKPTVIYMRKILNDIVEERPPFYSVGRRLNCGLSWNGDIKFFFQLFLLNYPSYNSKLPDGTILGLSVLKKMDV